MGISLKRNGWDLGPITIEADKTMSSSGLRRADFISLQMYMPMDLANR